MSRHYETRNVIWAAATTSQAIKLEGGAMFSIYLPSGFQGTSLKVETLEEDGTWAGYYHDVSGTSTQFSIPVTAGKRNRIAIALDAVDKVRFVSSATETITGALSMR